MSAPIEVDIPHQLGTAAAKERIGSGFGKLADFVIFDREPSAENLETVQIDATILGDRLIYDRAGHAPSA